MSDLIFTDPDDWDRFDAARNKLLDDCAQWLRAERGVPAGRADHLMGLAHLATDWKYRYGDGHLARWRPSEIPEFLIEWCPRKTNIDSAVVADVPEALACLLEFLDGTGRLDPSSGPVHRLATAARDLTARHVHAMGDPSNFGPARALMAAMEADGIDLDDPGALQAWLQGFNELPFEERARILPDDVFDGLAGPAGPGGPGPGAGFGGPGSGFGGPGFEPQPAVAPVVLPGDDEVRRSMSAAPVLGVVGALAGYIGEGGRKLTSTGNLTLADGRALVTLLGTGDRVDETIGGHTFRTRSAGDLAGLRHIMAWAYKAGVLRKRHGKVLATKRGLALAADPSGGPDPQAVFDRVVDALIDIGPLSSQHHPDSRLAWPEVNRLLDDLALVHLATLYQSPEPVRLAHLVALTIHVVNDQFRFQISAEIVERRLIADADRIIDALHLAGLVTRIDVGIAADAGAGAASGAGDEAGSDDVDDDVGERVALTPAGLVTTRRLLMEQGYAAPVAGELADLDAESWLLAVDGLDYPQMRAELDAWLAAHTPTDAAADLVAAIRAIDDPALRNVALSIMSAIDPALAVPAVRSLDDDPAVRGLVRSWLVDHDAAPVETLYDPADPGWFVDVLAVRLVNRGEEDVWDALSLAGDHRAQADLMDRLWRSPSTATDTMLTIIGQGHPSKAVAKAARRAVHQRRSWQGGI